MSSSASTRSSVDGPRDASTLPTLSPRPGSPESEEQKPDTGTNKNDMRLNNNDENHQSEEDEEDMDLKARALTKLLKTSSVCWSVNLENYIYRSNARNRYSLQSWRRK